MALATQDIIMKYLPQDLWDSANPYEIAEEFIIQMPDLIELILRSKSIDKPEDKQWWFSLLPLMNDEQIARLKEILIKEKVKLAEIEEKYEQKKIDIKKKYLSKWQEMNQAETVQKVKAAEAEHDAKEDAEAEALLSQI